MHSATTLASSCRRPGRLTSERSSPPSTSCEPGGSTNLEAGLRLGYSLARETLLDDGIDRVILASDGVANVGLTDADGILRQIRDDAAAGIELVSVGVGMGNYNDALLEQLADQGDGFYAYVNGLDEARRLFTEDLTGTIQSVALDAKVQVEFDPEVVAAYRLIGYENRAIADGDFRDPRVDAGAIGAGHSVTALYELTLREGFSREAVLGTVRLRWTEPEASRESSLARQLAASDLAGRFGSADPSFRFDAIVATSAEILRREDRSEHDLRDVLDVAREESGDLPQTDQVHAFLELLERMAAAARLAQPDGQAGSPSFESVDGAGRPGRQLADPARDRQVLPARIAGPTHHRSLSSAPANSTINARISECSVQAACGMSAGQTAASPAAIRVRSSPTPTQPPPSTTMNNDEFGFACGSVRAFRAKASSDTFPRPSEWRTWPLSPTDPIGPPARRWPTPNRRISIVTAGDP